MNIQGLAVESLADALEKSPAEVVASAVKLVMDFVAEKPDVANKSWPSLLKSMAFFNEVVGYMQGVRKKSGAQLAQ